MPAEYKYPLGIDLWAPLSLSEQQRAERTNQTIRVVARLAPGLSQGQAEAKLRLLASRLEQQYPTTNSNRSMTLLPMRQEQYFYTAPLFLMLQGAAIFVLLLACVNVANLLLARVISRQKEVAIRLSLGADRWRLLRLFISETIILSFIGGLAAVIVALWTVPIIRSSIPEGISKYVAGWTEIHVDGTVLGLTVLIVLVVGILFGIGTGVQSSKVHVNETLKEGGRTSAAGHHRLRSSLVIAEVVLSIVLLVGAGLTIKGFQHLVNVFQGFEPSAVLAFSTTLPDWKYSDDAKIAAFYDETIQNIKGMRNVKSVSVISNMPASNVDSPRTFFTIEGRPVLSASEQPSIDLQTVGSDIFQTLKIPILRGRAFSNQDAADATRTAIVSQTMAERFWPNEMPIGKRLKLGAVDSDSQWISVVGVVADVKQNWFDPQPRPVLYLPYPQTPARSLSFAIRTSGDPLSIAGDVRALISKVDSSQPISSIHTLDQEIRDSIAPIQIIGLLMVTFGGLSLVLSLIGIYGVIGYYVADRRREFGIRLALGAAPRDVLKIVLTQALKLGSIGVVIGLPAAFLFSRIMASALYGVIALDGVTFLGFTVLVMMTVLVASYIPARNAMKVDPMTALRSE